jgi:BMFP domain-containing protein YqiC
MSDAGTGNAMLRLMERQTAPLEARIAELESRIAQLESQHEPKRGALSLWTKGLVR